MPLRATGARRWSTCWATCLAGGEDPQRPGIVHRLDKDTSGLMVVARSDEAHRRLARLIKARQVRRSYLALVEGHPRSRTGTIDAPLGRDYRAPERRAVGGRGPRAARTHFEVLELLAEDALVEARLETGRTHQIRAHFAAIGHPVAGDPRYGQRGGTAWPASSSTAPSSASRHPFTDEELSLSLRPAARPGRGPGSGAGGAIGLSGGIGHRDDRSNIRADP